MMRHADLELTTTGTITDAPKVGPTMPPAFNLVDFARDSSSLRGLVVSPDTVLEVVPNVSWSAAGLDLVEMNVVRQIDGLSPVCLLEAVVGISRDELQVMLAMLLARGLIRVARDFQQDVGFEREPRSGVFSTVVAALEDDEDVARVG